MRKGNLMKALGAALGPVLGLALLAGCGSKADKVSEKDKVEGQPTVATSSATPASSPSQAAPQLTGPVVRITALGDSLFAGYGLRAEQAYPVRLEAALRARGINADVTNAGVSGDTTQDGRARLNFTLGQAAPPDLVVISLGGNDMLRGLPLAQTRENLDAILAELEDRKIKVVVMGMLAAPNMGPDYAKTFNAIYPSVTGKHHAVLEPFFLKAIFNRPDLQLPDHIHPTEKGVEAMVKATVDRIANALPKTPA